MKSTRSIVSLLLLFAALFCISTVTAFSQKKAGTKKKPAAKKTVVTNKIDAITVFKSVRGGGVNRANVAVNKLRIAMDYDNDGKADFTVFHPATNTWNIAKSAGGTISTPFGVASSDYFVPGDYDGDGIGDIANWRDAEHKWYILYSSTGVLHTIDFGASGDEPVARDYDNDGMTDLAVARRVNGIISWIIRKSSANPVDTANVTESTDWGISIDTPTPGDYDGDGKFDLSVRRPGATDTSLATFITKRSSDGMQENVSWGIGSDLVISGYFDADNKMDYAVLREGKLQTDPLVWMIRRSSDSTAVVMNYGTTGTSYNVQNDYDGDNITDIAVWDNATATFSVFRSTTSTTATFAWGAANDYPVASYDTR
ncbi:MAG: FG-GAP repeat domain-containing protein [Pyrinomonadaceae bacterium]